MSVKRALKILTSLGVSTLLVGGMATVAVAAPAPTIYVSKKHCSDSGPGTQKSPYCTIQEGVDAATPGTIVAIDKGTYVEQVTVGSGKNNVTLDGSGNKTIVQAPATMTATKTIVQVSTAQGVTVENMTVTGPGGSGCDSLEYGVRVDSGASATLSDLHVTKIEDTPFSGCQNGVGILVGHASESTTGTATIANSKVDNYQKGGIVVSNTGSSATIGNTNVTGVGPTTVIAQNGLQISSGATATISNAKVSGNVYTGSANAADGGVLLFDAGTVKLANVNATSNDVNVWLIGVKNSSFSNTVANKGTYNGVYVDPDSTGNNFTNTSAHNTAAGANNYDVEDDSTGSGTLGTANTWHNVSCKTSLPAGLCKQ